MWDEYSKPENESDEEHLLEKHLSRRTFLKTGLYGLMSAVFWRDMLQPAQAAARPGTSPREALHHPVYERWAVPIGYLRSEAHSSQRRTGPSDSNQRAGDPALPLSPPLG
ncbi:MAG: hypothetical protein KatS3mg115_0157 [Candidatus Poribacteria bacterium]|nr:MAG: hypothetical protein KatS3mg115_0157 [Candidatus Poribacteria bacterium]